MLRKIEYHPSAKLEIQKSAQWYDDRMKGLGLEFLLEVKSAESNIQKNPCPARCFCLRLFRTAAIRFINAWY